MAESSAVDELNLIYDQYCRFPPAKELDPELREILRGIIASINEIDARQKGILGTQNVLGSQNVLK